jgi:hypothetical protein
MGWCFCPLSYYYLSHTFRYTKIDKGKGERGRGEEREREREREEKWR